MASMSLKTLQFLALLLVLTASAACNRRAVVGEYRRTFDAGVVDDGGLP